MATIKRNCRNGRGFELSSFSGYSIMMRESLLVMRQERQYFASRQRKSDIKREPNDFHPDHPPEKRRLNAAERPELKHYRDIGAK